MSEFPRIYGGDRSELTPERLEYVVKQAFMVVAAAVVLGLFAVAAQLYWVAALIGACLLTLLVAWQFSAAVAIYALVACFVWGQTPDLATGGSGVGKGLYISELMLAFLISIWFVRYLFAALPKPRLRTGFHIPITLYIAYSVLNVVHSFIFWDPHVSQEYQYASVNFFELGVRLLSAGAFIVVATTVPNRKMLKWTGFSLCVPGLLVAINRLLGSSVDLAIPWWSLLCLLPSGYFCALALSSETAVWKRLGSIVALIAIGYVVVIQDVSWVSGWLGLLFTIATVIAIKNVRLFVVAILIAAVVTLMFWPFVHKNVVGVSEAEGDYQRFALWRIAWKYATTFPLGVGVGNYRSYNSYYYGVKWGATSHGSAHGTYAQLLTEMGIPGLVLFVWILVGGFRWMFNSYRRLDPGFSRTFVLAAMGQLIGISVASLLGDYIIPSYHNGGPTNFCATVYSWLIWGVAAAHIRISKTSDKLPENMAEDVK